MLDGINHAVADLNLLGMTGLAASGSGVVAGLMAAQSAIVTTAAAATPFGWVVAASALVSGLVIVAGNAEMASPCCWEQVLNSDELETEKSTLHREHGILLDDLATHCAVFKAEDDGRLILRNRKGQKYVFIFDYGK